MVEFDPTDVARWCGAEWRPAPPAGILGFCHDTRTLKPGNLYVAIRGDRYDGHDYVAEAHRLGACGSLVSSGFAARSSETPLLVVDDTRTALGRAAAGYRNSLEVPIVGVTGSAGKTTVVGMIHAALSPVMPVATTVANWNNNIGLPMSMLQMSRDARAGVFELGTNHPGEIRALSAMLQPTHGVVTTVGVSHTEFFDDVDAIAQEKADLLRSLGPDGTAVLVSDGPYFDTLRAAADCRVVHVSRSGTANYICEWNGRSEEAMTIREFESGESRSLRLPLPGMHNAVDASVAIAVGRELGADWDPLILGLEAYQPCAMRWESIPVRGTTIINDAYNANPLSMRAALDGFAGLHADGRKWLVLGDMLQLGSREQDEHGALGTLIGCADWTDLIAVGRRAAWIADAAEEASESIRVTHCEDSTAAAAHLRDAMQAGDAILLKASRGMKLEAIVDLLSV